MSARLMQILEFTLSDLPYNRRGQLSPQQEARTYQQRRRMKGILLVIGIVLLVLAGGWSVAFLQQEDLSARTAAVSAGLILFGIPGLVAVYLGIRPMKKVILETIKGKVKVARVEHTTAGTSPGDTRKRKYTLQAEFWHCPMKHSASWKTVKNMPSMCGKTLITFFP